VNTRTNLGLTAIILVLELCLLPIYGQNIMNTTTNTPNTIENTAIENRNVELDPSTQGTNKIRDIDSTELLNQVGEAAKKIAIGGANVLSNISGEIKKGLQ
jgi:hypothetical protein